MVGQDAFEVGIAVGLTGAVVTVIIAVRGHLIRSVVDVLPQARLVVCEISCLIPP